jgi:hypothetical protein
VTVIEHPTRGRGSDPDSNPDPAQVDPQAEPESANLAAVGRVLLELDPRQLGENPHNPRTDLG